MRPAADAAALSVPSLGATFVGAMQLATALAVGSVLLAGVIPVGVAASELSWDGPVGCVEPDRLRFEIERALGVPLEQAARLEFRVRVESAAPRASARLVVTGQDPGQESGERVLVASNCSKLVDTLAVAITLAIGASATSSPREAAPPRPAIATAEPARAPSSASRADIEATSASAERRSGPSPSALAGLVGDWGSLPSPALGAALGLELGWQRLQLRALATLLFDQDTDISSGPAGAPGGDIELAFGTLMACRELLGAEPSAFSLPLCVGGDVGRLRGAGRRVSEPRQRASLWVAPRLDAGLAWQVPDTELRLETLLGMAAPLNRDRFVLDDIGTVHQPRSVVGRVGLGIHLRFE